jgi:regulator of replication initiation timing
MDKLGRIMHAMSGASQDLVTLRRQARRLEAENTSLRAELRQLRRRLGSGAAPTRGPGSTPAAAPTPAASPSPGPKPDVGALSAAPRT